jgi:hypothetical protein
MGVISHPLSPPTSTDLTITSGKCRCHGAEKPARNELYWHYNVYSVEDGHVIPGLINKCYMAKTNGKF